MFIKNSTVPRSSWVDHSGERTFKEKKAVQGRKVDGVSTLPTKAKPTVIKVTGLNILNPHLAAANQWPKAPKEICKEDEGIGLPSYLKRKIGNNPRFQFGSFDFDMTSSSKGKKESFLSKPKMVTKQNILNPNSRGGMISSKIRRTIHKIGVFGAYVCDDPKAFTILTAADHLDVNGHELEKHHGLSSEQWNKVACDSGFELSLTCFNWETISEICKERENSKELKIDFQNNMKFIRDLTVTSKGRIRWELEYSTVNNDLTDRASKWRKLSRFYECEMIFFNPYAELPGVRWEDVGKGTTRLIDAFFVYAQHNLVDVDGVVTLMWNPIRKDGLEVVEIPSIARINGFKIVDLRSARNIHRFTTFKHYMNAESLSRSLEKGTSTVVSSKNTDTIIIFKKVEASLEIPPRAKITSSFGRYLPKADSNAENVLRNQERKGEFAIRHKEKNEERKNKRDEDKNKELNGEWVKVRKAS